MAYPNYFPATYQPYFYQPVQQQNTQTSMIWVNSEQEAQNYPVAPNNAVALWNSSEPIIYVKQADASGRPMLKMFDLVERKQSAPTASSSKSSGDIDFATKQDLEALGAKLREEFAALRKKVDDDE